MLKWTSRGSLHRATTRPDTHPDKSRMTTVDSMNHDRCSMTSMDSHCEEMSSPLASIDATTPTTAKPRRGQGRVKQQSVSKICNMRSEPNSPLYASAKLTGRGIGDRKQTLRTSNSLPFLPRDGDRKRSYLFTKLKKFFRKTKAQKKNTVRDPYHSEANSLKTFATYISNPLSPTPKTKEYKRSEFSSDHSSPKQNSKTRLGRLIESKKAQRKLLRSMKEKKDDEGKHYAIFSSDSNTSADDIHAPPVTLQTVNNLDCPLPPRHLHVTRSSSFNAAMPGQAICKHQQVYNGNITTTTSSIDHLRCKNIDQFKGRPVERNSGVVQGEIGHAEPLRRSVSLSSTAEIPNQLKSLGSSHITNRWSTLSDIIDSRCSAFYRAEHRPDLTAQNIAVSDLGSSTRGTRGFKDEANRALLHDGIACQLLVSATTPETEDSSLVEYRKSMERKELGGLGRVKVMTSDIGSILQAKASLSPLHIKQPRQDRNRLPAQTVSQEMVVHSNPDSFRWSVACDNNMLISLPRPRIHELTTTNVRHYCDNSSQMSSNLTTKNNNNGHNNSDIIKGLIRKPVYPMSIERKDFGEREQQTQSGGQTEKDYCRHFGTNQLDMVYENVNNAPDFISKQSYIGFNHMHSSEWNRKQETSTNSERESYACLFRDAKLTIPSIKSNCITGQTEGVIANRSSQTFGAECNISSHSDSEIDDCIPKYLAANSKCEKSGLLAECVHRQDSSICTSAGFSPREGEAFSLDDRRETETISPITTEDALAVSYADDGTVGDLDELTRDPVVKCSSCASSTSNHSISGSSDTKAVCDSEKSASVRQGSSYGWEKLKHESATVASDSVSSPGLVDAADSGPVSSDSVDCTWDDELSSSSLRGLQNDMGAAESPNTKQIIREPNAAEESLELECRRDPGLSELVNEDLLGHPACGIDSKDGFEVGITDVSAPSSIVTLEHIHETGDSCPSGADRKQSPQATAEENVVASPDLRRDSTYQQVDGSEMDLCLGNTSPPLASNHYNTSEVAVCNESPPLDLRQYVNETVNDRSGTDVFIMPERVRDELPAEHSPKSKAKKKVSFQLDETVLHEPSSSFSSDMAIMEVMAPNAGEPYCELVEAEGRETGQSSVTPRQQGVVTSGSWTDVSCSFSDISLNTKGGTSQMTSTSADDISWWGAEISDGVDFFFDHQRRSKRPHSKTKDEGLCDQIAPDKCTTVTNAHVFPCTEHITKTSQATDGTRETTGTDSVIATTSGDEDKVGHGRRLTETPESANNQKERVPAEESGNFPHQHDHTNLNSRTSKISKLGALNDTAHVSSDTAGKTVDARAKQSVREEPFSGATESTRTICNEADKTDVVTANASSDDLQPWWKVMGCARQRKEWSPTDQETDCTQSLSDRQAAGNEKSLGLGKFEEKQEKLNCPTQINDSKRHRSAPKCNSLKQITPSDPDQQICAQNRKTKTKVSRLNPKIGSKIPLPADPLQAEIRYTKDDRSAQEATVELENLEHWESMKSDKTFAMIRKHSINTKSGEETTKHCAIDEQETKEDTKESPKTFAGEQFRFGKSQIKPRSPQDHNDSTSSYESYCSFENPVWELEKEAIYSIKAQHCCQYQNKAKKVKQSSKENQSSKSDIDKWSVMLKNCQNAETGSTLSSPTNTSDVTEIEKQPNKRKKLYYKSRKGNARTVDKSSETPLYQHNDVSGDFWDSNEDGKQLDTPPLLTALKVGGMARMQRAAVRCVGVQCWPLLVETNHEHLHTPQERHYRDSHRRPQPRGSSPSSSNFYHNQTSSRQGKAVTLRSASCHSGEKDTSSPRNRTGSRKRSHGLPKLQPRPGPAAASKRQSFNRSGRGANRDDPLEFASDNRERHNASVLRTRGPDDIDLYGVGDNYFPSHNGRLAENNSGQDRQQQAGMGNNNQFKRQSSSSGADLCDEQRNRPNLPGMKVFDSQTARQVSTWDRPASQWLFLSTFFVFQLLMHWIYAK